MLMKEFVTNDESELLSATKNVEIKIIESPLEYTIDEYYINSIECFDIWDKYYKSISNENYDEINLKWHYECGFNSQLQRVSGFDRIYVSGKVQIWIKMIFLLCIWVIPIIAFIFWRDKQENNLINEVNTITIIFISGIGFMYVFLVINICLVLCEIFDEMHLKTNTRILINVISFNVLFGLGYATDGMLKAYLGSLAVETVLVISFELFYYLCAAYDITKYIISKSLVSIVLLFHIFMIEIIYRSSQMDFVLFDCLCYKNTKY